MALPGAEAPGLFWSIPVPRAPFKDPHIAQIDALEKLHRIKMNLQTTMAIIKSRTNAGQTLSEDELLMIKAYRQNLIDATRKVQDEFLEELAAHGIEP